ADRQIREREHAVGQVAELLAERPRAAPDLAATSLVRDELAAEPEPQHEPDERGVGLAERDQAIAECAVAAEDVDAALRHIALDEPAIQGPEQARGQRRIGAA